jgi:YD repeat-containing protein
MNYTYDALGRLTSAGFAGGPCTTYLYDSAGNRTQATSGAGAAPTANAVSATAYQDLATTLDPRINDPSCLGLTLTAVGSPSHGTATLGGSGTYITYTPAAGYTGTDSFSYTITSSAGSASNTVTITVIAPTLAPVANTGTISYHHTVPPAVTPTGYVTLANIASDPYGYPLTVTCSTPTSGTASCSSTYLTYVYGSSVSTNLFTTDSFTYTLNDGHGHTTTGVVNVSINVNSID